MLLADWAEEINGKLYVQGAGWTRAGTATPISMALAVLVSVPWDQANRPHKIHAALMTDDGEVVMQPPGEAEPKMPVELEGQLEVGRPPGSRPGTPLNAPLGIRFQGVVLQPGAYSWHFEVDGQELAAIPFEVVEGSVT